MLWKNLRQGDWRRHPKTLRRNVAWGGKKIAYQRFQKTRRIERSEIGTVLREGEVKGIEKGIEKVAINAIKQGVRDESIIERTGIAAKQLEKCKRETRPNKA